MQAIKAAKSPPRTDKPAHFPFDAFMKYLDSVAPKRGTAQSVGALFCGCVFNRSLFDVVFSSGTCWSRTQRHSISGVTRTRTRRTRRCKGSTFRSRADHRRPCSQGRPSTSASRSCNLRSSSSTWRSTDTRHHRRTAAANLASSQHACASFCTSPCC